MTIIILTTTMGKIKNHSFDDDDKRKHISYNDKKHQHLNNNIDKNNIYVISIWLVYKRNAGDSFSSLIGRI